MQIALVATLLSATLALQPIKTARADQCAFPFTPTAYEDLKDRHLFLDTIDLAANNMLFPGDPYFGVPDIQMGTRGARYTIPGTVPPVLLKSIAWIESSITQAGADVPFGSIGSSLISFDCGHGIEQVTTGMTVPTGESGKGSPEQALVATNFAYNIARGAAILVNKWNEAPDKKPIAGIDTNGHPSVLENWYFAVWGYNGFTGPGSNKSNHPLDPIYGAWPRPAFSCSPAGDGKGHNRSNYPYQELVFGCAANPPVIEGKQLWAGQTISLPDLNNPIWRNSLNMQNFVYPYAKMDMYTPPPFHLDQTPAPDPNNRTRILGTPSMILSKTDVRVGFSPGATGSSTSETVDVANSGTGVLSWYATASVPWLTISPYTGVAVGTDLPCATGNPCDRVGHLDVSVDPAKTPQGRQTATIQIKALGSNQVQTVNVDVVQVQRITAAANPASPVTSTNSTTSRLRPILAARQVPSTRPVKRQPVSPFRRHPTKG